jgi:two-component system CheB/CheR fusion protein
MNSPTHIVGIGASAGGLAALEELFKSMPEDTGMAFVLVQHLSPDFRSRMEELLAHFTRMSIHIVENGMELKADSVYLIPPRQMMTVADSRLWLEECAGPHPRLPIDGFFESLAGAAQSRAIGIILSGTGSDGLCGVEAIHEAGGLVIVQTAESAQFNGMPRAAVGSGMYDYEAAPEEMPALLLDYARDPDRIRTSDAALKIIRDEDEFAEIFAFLRRGYGLDFSKYKPTTVGRRIARRMNVHSLQNLSEYRKLLETDPLEPDGLYHDLLIGVTEFFRNPPAFSYLEQEIIPALFREASSEWLRVWVAACATGEEAYSLAMLFHQYAEKIRYPGKISVFATDVHRKSLDFASQGVYGQDRLQNVSEEYLTRYFTSEGSGRYRIDPELRKMLVFAPQNLISDPPFTKMDMTCCRNLLIYFMPETQEKALAALNFSLRTGGVLFLGTSEGVANFTGEFAVIHSAYKVFRKQRDVRLNVNLNQIITSPALLTPTDLKRSAGSLATIDRQILHDYDHLLERYMPAGVLLNEQLQVLHYFGDIDPYLKPLRGRTESSFPQMMADEELCMAISMALRQAALLKTRFTQPDILLNRGKDARCVDLAVDVIPFEKTNSVHYMVTVSPVKTAVPTTAPAESEAIPETMKTSQTMKAYITDLEKDLHTAQENLQATFEELSSSNEELQATNEELRASNEELQSTNEELHSLNEELYAVNAEFEKKNAELHALNNDHIHLLSSLEVGVVFLDERLNIRKFNTASTLAFKLLPQDIGRPIDHIAYHLTDQAALLKSLREVLQTGQSVETEVRADNGVWLLQRILPFISQKNAVSGVILTFTDVTKIKSSEARLRALFDVLPAGINILDKDHNVLESNAEAERILMLKQEALIRGDYYKRRYIRPDGSPMPADEFASVRVIREQKTLYDIEIGIIREDDSLIWTNVNAAPLPDGGVVVIFADMTRRKQTEEALRKSERRLREAQRIAHIASWEWNLRTGETHWSPENYVIHGFSEDSPTLTPDTLIKIVHPDDQEKVKAAISQTITDGTPVDIKYRVFRPDGSIRVIHAVGMVTESDADGRPSLMVGTNQDITDRRQAEEELHRRENLLREMGRIAKIGGWELDVATMKQRWTDETYVIHGRKREEYDPDSMEEISRFEPGSKELIEKAFGDAITQGIPYDLEVEMTTVDGNRKWVRAVCSPLLVDGKVTKLTGAVQDITDRRQTEEKLRENEERLELVMQGSQLGYWDWNIETGEVHRNARWAEMIGYTLEEIAHSVKQWTDLHHPDDCESAWKSIQDHLDGKTPAHRTEYRMRTKDGKYKWILDQAKVVKRDAEGKPLRMSGTHTDITDRKQMEERLRLEKEKLDKIAATVPGVICSFHRSLTGKTGMPYASPVAKEVYGFDPQDIADDMTPVFSRILPEDMEHVSATIAQSAQTMTVWKDEFRYRHPSKGMIWIEGHSMPVREADGSITWHGFIADITERKQAEEKLRVAMNSLQEAQKIAHLGSFEYVAATQTTVWSEEEYRIYGLDPSGPSPKYDEMLARYIHPDDAAMLHETFMQAIQSRSVYEVEHRIVRPDGIVRWVYDLAHPYTDDQGELVRYVGTTLDITERRKAEDKLRESEQRLRLTIETTSDGFWIVDPSRRLLDVNQAYLDMSGYTRGEFLSMGVSDVEVIESPQDTDARIRRILQNGSDRFETRHRRKDGSIFDVEVSVNLLGMEPAQMICFCRDITERKQAEEKLRDLNRTLEHRVEERTAEIRDLYNNSPSGYHSLDNQGRFLMINDTELKWLGRTGEQVIGHSFAEFIAPNQVTFFETVHMPALRETGIVRDVEYDMIRSDGSIFPVLLNAEAVYDNNGNFLNSRSTTVDISERKIAENALRESLDQLTIANIALEKASRTKDEFLANMSHELRTPLNGILSAAEILSEEIRGPLNERQRRMVGTIDSSGSHLLNLINDILDLSKIEAEKLELDIRPVGIKSVCQASMLFIKEPALKKRIAVDFVSDEAVSVIEADERRLKQIILNLLGNAVKFTPAGGKITLEVRLNREKSCVELSVSDTGIGISAENQKRLFAPFTQADGSLSRSHEGTGLGLALVKRLAELHGGSASVESEKGKGSRFIVLLPCQETAPVPQAPLETAARTVVNPPEPAEHKNKGNILVVEDNPVNAEIIGDYLNAKGYSITYAHDGSEALEKAARNPFDLILMDIQMPEVDGMEATRRLRADPKFASTPIIALTALAMIGDRERCLEAGMTDYITKPVRLTQLLSMIEALLEKSR